ncbi:hypothetical protein [Desulfovibrio porci]|uniref:hypothetical protein n=1 Tax=Desulfovibrio porci TaxID=2605782 RepID=UPI003A95135A
MAIVKGIIKDAQGNELHAKTSADNVARGDSTIDADLSVLETDVSTAKSDISTLQGDVSALQGAVAGQTKTYVVADIAARDAVTGMSVGDQVWVKDATADSTVTKGAAKYIYEGEDTGWVKTAEAESMDVVINWGDVQGKQVDTAIVESGAAAPANLAPEGFYFEKASA